MMAANTFTDDSVGRIFNHFFVNYKQDMEHNEGPQLAPIFHIEAYPTYLFIRPNGDIFYRAMGYMPPANFIQTTLAALGADANLDSLINRGKKGKISTDVLWLFAYEDGNKTYFPKPIEKADVFQILSNDLWLKKYEIISKIYGFAPESWEAKTTPKAEAFWVFSDAKAVKVWMENLLIKNKSEHLIK